MSRFKKRSANTTISITAAIFAQKQILKTPLWCGGGNHSMTKYEFLFFGRSEEKGVYQKLLFIVIYNRKISNVIWKNIASNVTRNQEYKHITNLNVKAHPSTQNNYWEHIKNSKLKKQDIFDFHKKS